MCIAYKRTRSELASLAHSLYSLSLYCTCNAWTNSALSVSYFSAFINARRMLTEGFQLGDFVKRLSFLTYSLFLALHCQTSGHLQLSVLLPAFSESDDHYLKYMYINL